MKTVEKPWGREIWIAYDNGRYAGKLLEIRAGHRLSLQYHQKKHETLYLLDGKIRFLLEDDSGNLVDEVIVPGGIKIVPPGSKHRMEAIRDSRFIEFSSPELDDVVRIEDDYSRIPDKRSDQMET
ncbi:cupin [bacterium]|nr:cupin [candidate division CSSED10-310 bacterium]